MVRSIHYSGLISVFWLGVWTCVAQEPGRVILLSLDGMGEQLFRNDPVTSEMGHLREIAAGGTGILGMQTAFPSTTANSHAVLWTGTWGDRNGIHANDTPVMPRAEHAVTERVNGYRSDSLTAEPLWLAAARQGIGTVAFQATQAFPFNERNTRRDLRAPLVVVNGYQTRNWAPHRALRMKDVEKADTVWAPASRRRPIAFRWRSGPVQFDGLLTAESGPDYDAAYVTADGWKTRVRAALAPTESTPPRERALARHFSAGLWVDQVPCVVFFRLFEAAPDGSDFLLYQTDLQSYGYFGGDEREALRAAAGFIGNAPKRLLDSGAFGKPMDEGGDTTAERRYLEIVELVVRQSMAHAKWLFERHQPRLMIGYLNYPDETDHAWLGLSAARHPHADAMRRWAYVAIDHLVGLYRGMAGPEDHLVVVADHGMQPVFHHARIPVLLREAGLEKETSYVRGCVLINTTDWKSGLVEPAQREAVIRRVIAALKQREEFTRFYWRDGDRRRFGLLGLNSPDLCFDMAKGWGPSSSAKGEWREDLKRPLGEHGADPSRADMRPIFIAAGPRFKKGAAPRFKGLRSIDVAPTIAALLGIQPPAQAAGRALPLR